MLSRCSQAASEIRCGTQIPTTAKDKWDSIALQMVDTFKCRTSYPMFPATEPLPLGQLRKGGRKYHFQGTFSSKPFWQATHGASTIAFASGMRLRIRYLQPRRAEDEAHMDREPEQLTLITQKQRNVQQSRGDSMQQLTANRETLIRRASEQASFARTLENGQFYITNQAVLEGNSSTLLCTEHTDPMNFQFKNTGNSQRSCQDWTSDSN